MALDSLPPWLDVSPQQFVRAASEGAAAGLGARHQYASEVEAGDRLRLAYDQLASEERRANERAQSAMEIAGMKMQLQAQQNEAALALKEQQAASLDAYRMGKLDQFDIAEARRRKAADDLEANRAQKLALQTARQADLRQKAEDLRAWRQSVESRKMAEWSVPDRTDYQASVARLATIQRELDKELQFGVQLDPTLKQDLIDEGYGIMRNLDSLRQRYPGYSASTNLAPQAALGVTGTGTNAPPMAAGAPAVLGITAGAPLTPPSPASGTGSVQAKIDRANQLRKDNPDWTKAEIIEQVNNEFP